jgi:hypothetical protein
MLKELVGQGAELGGEGEKMIVIFHLGVWYTEERLTGDKLKDYATETLDIKSIVNSSGKNQLGSSETDWSDGLLWWIGNEICYSGQAGISLDIRQEEGTDNRNRRD